MNTKFITILEDLDQDVIEEGRPKKVIDPDAPVKEKGKRGRPKADPEDKDDSGEEGKRDLTLYAYISGGRGKNKQEATENKTIKGASVEDIKKLVQNFENVLTVKFANKWDFDEDEINVDIKDNLGWSGAKATEQDTGGSVASAGAEENE